MKQTYTFKCLTHGQFEVKQNTHDEHIADCPKCHMPSDRVYLPVPHVWEPYSNPNHPERRGVEG